jgi:hypothetical protein
MLLPSLAILSGAVNATKVGGMYREGILDTLHSKNKDYMQQFEQNS